MCSMHIIMRTKWSKSLLSVSPSKSFWSFSFHFSLVLIKDHCLNFIVKDENFNEIVLSNDFVTLDKPLMVEIIRKRVFPGRVNDLIRTSRLIGTTLENDMAAFLRNGGKDFCDINLVLDDQIIPAHKSILAARCSYFQAMFRSFMPPDNTVNVRKTFRFHDPTIHHSFSNLFQIQIGDVTPSQEAFGSLLRYIYYGETRMPPEDSLYLFQASCFYGKLMKVLTGNRWFECRLFIRIVEQPLESLLQTQPWA